MKKAPKSNTLAMLAKMSPDEQREAMLLLETLNRPKLARYSGTAAPLDNKSLRAAIEAGNKRAEMPGKAEQDAKDEAELLEWFDRFGKDQELDVLTAAHVRLARHKRGDFNAIYEAQRAKIEKDKAEAANAAKPTPPTAEVNEQEGPPAMQPAIEMERSREPQSIIEALCKPHRDYSMQIGEGSLGNWRRN